jgi:tetratricopeptide (TPR) repeat protein
VRKFRSEVFGVLVAVVALAPQAGAQQQQPNPNRWAAPRCDLKPGHFMVNSGLLYLKSATETKFEDQKQKDLTAAHGVLMQALTTGEQTKNPAAWYYLARYDIMTQDLTGADSAFRQAEALKPDCADDIGLWRRFVWIGVFNNGIAAWQANNTDSAMASFRRANAIYQAEPTGFKYMATLLYQGGQLDSAVVYFRRAADIAAKDSKFQQDRKDALFNMARIEHSQKHWTEAQTAYREYLTLYPNDPEAQASLASVLSQTGQRDSAFAMYRRIIALGDSVGAMPMFRVGVEIFQAVSDEPDTGKAGGDCRTQARANRLTPVRIKARCDSVTKGIIRDYETASGVTYRLAAEAFEAGLKMNPYYRDGLYNLMNAYLQVNDSPHVVPVARRLVGVDPMNRMSIRLLAFAHQRVGRVDSTLYYLRLADSTLVADVTLSEFDPQDSTARVKGLVTNLRDRPGQPFKLVFEFLNAQGDALAKQSTDVPALPPQGTQLFEIQVAAKGVVAWRYHKE